MDINKAVYRLTNLTSKKFRFLINRNSFILNPQESLDIDLSKHWEGNKDLRSLIKEISITHRKYIKIEEIKTPK